MIRALCIPDNRIAPAHHARGFTLVEVLVVIVIVGILFAMGGFMLDRGFAAFFLGKDISEADWQGRLALERMSRELRLVRSATLADLTIVNPAQIAFTDTGGDNVVYDLDAPSATLRRTENGTPQALAHNVSGLSFSYLRADGRTAESLDPTQVFYVTVAVTISQDAATTTTYRTTVQPRNF